MILKRGFDIFAGIAGLVLASPVILATAVAMKYANGGNLFFRQERVGAGGKPFTIFKIKTMKDAFNKAGEPLPDEERLTKAGRFVRKTRLDELPQLVNVIRGDMSLVGPRPIRNIYNIAADPERMSVRPGLTGLAQINGNNKLSGEQVLDYDRHYIREIKSRPALSALFYDLSVIVRTPLSLIRHADSPVCRTPPSDLCKNKKI